MNTLKRKKLKIFNNAKLYLVSSQEFSSYSSLYVIEEALKGGLKLFQMREKLMSYEDKLNLAKKLKKLSLKYNAIFLINDDVEIAKAVDADGVHLGQDDTSIKKARAILGEDKIIGLSTHNYMEAMAAIKLAIDYINIGPVNVTNTKQHLKVVSDAEIKKIIKDMNIPFTFMGGIKANNMKEFMKYRPAALAMVTELTMAKNILSTCKKNISALKGLQSEEEGAKSTLRKQKN